MASPRQYATALRSYAPNQSQTGGYVSNPFAGGAAPQQVTSMAPHLSVAAASRPHASDIALLETHGYGDRLPDLDKMWNYSPQTYESRVAALLRENPAKNAISYLKQGLNPETGEPLKGTVIPTTYIDPETGEVVVRRTSSGGDSD